MRINKGYTLVEMIIVIAIMAIMAGFATVTFGIVRKAKCNAAIDTFNNQLTSLSIKTKSLSQSKNQATPLDSTSEASKYPICLMVRRNDSASPGGKYPPYDSDRRKKDAYIMYLGYCDKSNNFVIKEEVGILPKAIEIDYKSSDTSQVHDLAMDKEHKKSSSDAADDSSDSKIDTFVIKFNKSDGSVKNGAGTYTFYVGDDEYGSVILNSTTGNHYTR